MIYKPEICIECDTKGCNESVFLEMKWSLFRYHLTKSKIKKMLVEKHYWTVIDDKHYCDYCSRKEGSKW